MLNENDCDRIPCGEGEIVLGGPVPPIPTFIFGPAPTIDCLEETPKPVDSEYPEIILGSPCPPLKKISFFERRKMATPPHNPLEGERPELSLDLQSNSEEQVSIIIVHKDRPEYLNICLQSIAVTSVNNNYEIIVSDNNSGQDSQDFFEDIKDEVTVVKNKENLYWAGAANKGAAKASKDSKYLIFLHSDVVILNPAWIDLLINVSESSNSGLVGLELQSYFMQNQKVDFIQEWCILVTRECWEEIGPFEERLPQIGAPFIFTVEAQTKGFKPQVMKNIIAHHYKIFSLDINEYERLIERAMVTIPQIVREKQGRSL